MKGENKMKKDIIYEKIHKEYLKHDSLCMLYELGHIVFDGLLYRTYAPRTFLVDNKRKYVYFENPKVVTSSIKACIHESEVKDDGSIHAVMKKRMTHKWKKKYDDYYKFTFIRNPFERMFSCYINRYHAPEQWIGKKNAYKYYLFGYMKKDNGFDEFARKSCKIPNWLMDKHLKPQYLLIYDKGGSILVDFVGRYENLIEDWKVVQKNLGFKNLLHLNQSKKKNWMDFYTKELADIVYQRYKNDFELLGYKDEYTKLLEYLEQKDRESWIANNDVD